MRQTVLLMVLLGMAAITPAHAQRDGRPAAALEAIMVGRQAGMDLQSAIVGLVKQAVEIKAKVKSYKDGADAIVAWSKAIPGMFRSGTEQGHSTKALPAVWSDRSGFEKAAANLTDNATKLVRSAEADDKPGFAAAYQATTPACDADHRAYRAR